MAELSLGIKVNRSRPAKFREVLEKRATGGLERSLFIFFQVRSEMADGMHQPVLKREIVNNLGIKKRGLYLDATLGDGGHTEGILKKISPHGRVIGIDWDKEAIKRAKRRLSCFKNQVIFIRENYRFLPMILQRLKIDKVDAILLDLGISSLQLDSRWRGFSFRFQAPLDMRMDERISRKAGDFINKLSEDDLMKLFFQFGEERYSKRIAKSIVKVRSKQPIKTTFELEKIVRNAVSQNHRFGSIHPATRIFQALRIAVNQELDNLRIFLKASICFLKKGGRIAVISYHSLEDRIVKTFFKDLAKTGLCPKDYPIYQGEIQPQLKILTAKPIRPKEEEIKRNPRSRSAKLRIAEKL